jgi:hypothetical protein
MNAPAMRELKRMIRRAAPGLTERLSAAMRARRGAAAVNAARFASLAAHIENVQRRFDAQFPVEESSVAEVAAHSSIVVIGTAPFDNVALLIDELRRESVVPGEIVIVDATAEAPRLVAIRDHVASWKWRLPLTRFKVVPYTLQDLRYADAVAQGVAAATRDYIWIAGYYDVPLERCFEYLFKTFVQQQRRAVVASCPVGPDANVREIALDARTVAAQTPTILDAAKRTQLVAGAVGQHRRRREDVALVGAVEAFAEGIFGGPRALLLAEGDDPLLDTRLTTNLSVTELSLRLKARGIATVRSGCAFSRSVLNHVTDGAPQWEAIHDLRRIARAHDALPASDDERIEIVCPFHRGDMLLAVHVAAYAASLGKSVRLHVAEPLVSWAREFAPQLDIESVPVPVASAAETYPVLLDSYQYVSMRSDAVPRIARCHPARSLSETGRNLVDYMLEQAGLPLDTRLPNLIPASTDEQRRIARELVDAIGGDVVFVHPLGGWELKSIPPHIMAELAEEMHGAGLKLIQIGGAGDRRVDHTDGAILQNFMPSQWKEILALGRALICVDSWTSHFAAILDMPQICMYGSTHPVHVNSKRWFRNQLGECLNLGPIVNCSPCNSLTCIAYPQRDYCTGYAVERAALRDFLAGVTVQNDQ